MNQEPIIVFFSHSDCRKCAENRVKYEEIATNLDHKAFCYYLPLDSVNALVRNYPKELDYLIEEIGFNKEKMPMKFVDAKPVKAKQKDVNNHKKDDKMPVLDDAGVELGEILVDAGSDDPVEQEEEREKEIDVKTLQTMMNKHDLYHKVRVYAFDKDQGSYKCVDTFNYNNFPSLQNDKFRELVGLPTDNSQVDDAAAAGSAANATMVSYVTRKISYALGLEEDLDDALTLNDALSPNLYAKTKPKLLDKFYDDAAAEGKRKFQHDTKIPLPETEKFPSTAEFSKFSKEKYNFYLNRMNQVEDNDAGETSSRNWSLTGFLGL